MCCMIVNWSFFFFQAEDGIRDLTVTGVQTCALPIYPVPGGGGDGSELPAADERRVATAALDGHVVAEALDSGGELVVDWKRVVEGKSVDVGGRRIIKKKKLWIHEGMRAILIVLLQCR